MPIFELSRLRDYDDESLLTEVRRVANLVPGEHLTERSFDELAKCSSSVVRRRFRSWQQALIAAGIPQRFSGGVGGRGRKREAFTDEELLGELRVVSRRVKGQPLTMELFKGLGRMNPETIRRRFGSWSAALKSAGLLVAPLGRRYSDEQYFENLLRVWTHYGRQPTYGEMDRPPSRIPSGAYEAKWGTWKNALLAFIQRAESESAAPLKPEPAAPTAVPQRVMSRPRSGKRERPTRRPEELRQIPLGLRYRVLVRDQSADDLEGVF